MDIAEAIRTLAKQGETVSNKGIKVAKVLAVDGQKCDVELLDTEFEISGVRLQADVETTANGILPIPAINSFVIIAPIDDFEYVVVLFSKLESIQFLDGSYGGLVKVNDLVGKVNNLENQVNDLLTTLQSIVIPLAPSGTYPFAPVFSGFTPLTPTQPGDIQNDKIQHGTV